MDRFTEKSEPEAEEATDGVAPMEKGEREAGDAVEDAAIEDYGLNAKRQRLEESTVQTEIKLLENPCKHGIVCFSRCTFKVTTSAKNGHEDSELGGLEEYTIAVNKKEPAVTDGATEKEPKLDNPKTHVIQKEQMTGAKTLFVGNLSFAVEQEDVEDFFKAAGEVVSIRFGMNQDETFRGFGYVEFASAEAAEKALYELNGKELLRRPVRLDITKDRRSYAPYSGSMRAQGQRNFDGGRSSWRRDFGGGRSSWRSSWHDSGGKREAEDVVEEEVSNAKRLKLEENAVQYETKVTTSANKKDETSVKSESLYEVETSSDAVTKKAYGEPELDTPKTHVIPKEQITGSKTLFVGNLSFSVEQEDVEDFFKAAGEVVSIRFGMNSDETFRGFGHVEFASAEAAVKALHELNGKELLRRPVRLDITTDRRSYAPYSGKDNQFIQMGGRAQGQRNFEVKDNNAFNKALKLHESEHGGSALSVEEVRPRWDTGGSGHGRSGGLRGVGNSWRGGGRDFGGGRSSGHDWRGGGRDVGGGRSSWRGHLQDSGGKREAEDAIEEEVSNAKRQKLEENAVQDETKLEWVCTSIEGHVAAVKKLDKSIDSLDEDIAAPKNKDESRSDVRSAGEDDVTAKNSLIVVAQKKNVSNEEAKLDAKIHVTPKVQITGSKTLFVGSLSSAVKKEDLERFFKAAGEVVDIRFGVNLASRRYGHVEFASAEAAEKALHEMNGKELMRCPVKLEIAKGRRSYSPYSGNDNEGHRIFVRGFNKFDGEDKIRSSLEEHFGSCGEITKISIPRDRFDQDGAIKGIALINFKDDDAFNKALKLDKSRCRGNTLSVEKARPKYDTGGSVLGRGGLESGGTSSWSSDGWGWDSGGRNSWSRGGWSSGGSSMKGGGENSWSGGGSSSWSSGWRDSSGSNGGRGSGGSSSWSAGGNRMSSGGQGFSGNSWSSGGVRGSGGSSSWSGDERGSGGNSWRGGRQDSGGRSGGQDSSWGC